MLIKLASLLSRSQIVKPYARIFEEEWCTCNLRPKRRRLNGSKNYPFELENAEKTALFSMESISKRDFRKIYTASKKSARGKWKISLFSKRISLNWNWQRDFCYETTNIQPHRSTSKFLAIRDKGSDFRYFSHTLKILQSLLISL